jgi:hypothetical protein
MPPPPARLILRGRELRPFSTLPKHNGESRRQADPAKKKMIFRLKKD